MCCLLPGILHFLTNTVLFAVITGIVASFCYDKIVKYRKSQDFENALKHLLGPNDSEFDWVAYSMKPENGRLHKDEPNGSKVNIRLVQGDILQITLKHGNEPRQWTGQLIMKNHNYGEMVCHYEKEHEYRFINVYIGVEEENSVKYDYLFFIDRTDKQDYGNELVRREQKHRYKTN